jgi:hypothetical protein
MSSLRAESKKISTPLNAQGIYISKLDHFGRLQNNPGPRAISKRFFLHCYVAVTLDVKTARAFRRFGESI